MPRSLAALALIISLSLSTAVSALSIGEIKLQSALNQPFSANVSLTATQAEEIESLKVTLASQAAFDGYGIDRPEYLQKIRFSVRRTGATQGVLEMRGTTPVSEPFVTLLVKFSWSTGNLLREYTVLLDPPVFDTALSAAPVQQATISAPVSAVTPDAAPASTQAPTPARSTPVRQPAATSAAPRPAPAVRQPAYNGDSYGPIGSGQSLWGIANRVRGGTDASVNQMMVALFRANPQAFMGNINRMKAGSILRMPATDELAAVSVTTANAEVVAQHEAWKTGAPIKRAADSPAQPAQLKLVAPSGQSASGGDGVATPDAGDGSGAQSGDVAALRDDLEEAQRLLAVRDAELQALQQRLADVEGGTVVDVMTEDTASVDGATVDAMVDDELVLDADGNVIDEMVVSDEVVLDADGNVIDEALTVDETVDEAAMSEDAAEVAPAAETAVTTVSTGNDNSASDGVFGFLSSIWLWIGLAVIVVVGLVFFRRKSAAPAIGSLLDDDDDEERPESREDRGAPIARALPEDYAPSALTQSMVVEESAAEETLKRSDGDSGLNIDDDEIPGLEASRQGADVAPPDDFDIGLDTVGQDDQDMLSGDFADDEEATFERTTEIERTDPDYTQTVGSETAINLDHSDPIAEADFHMAYGLYDQAADLLVKALADEPEDKLLRVKLLEVYFVWENKEGFITEARTLHDQVGDNADAEWNKVVIMGKQICPDDPLFEGDHEGVGGAQILDIQLESGAGDDSVDVDFANDSDAEQGLDFDFGGDDSSYDDIDFDIGDSDSPTTETPTVEAPGTEAPTMETPTIEAPGAESPTMETPTIEMPAADSDTASIDLDDLDVDLDDLDLLNDDDADASDNESMDIADDDATLLASALDVESYNPDADAQIGEDDATMLADTTELTEFIKNGLDTESSDETVEQPQFTDDGDTVEQPGFDELTLEEDSSSDDAADSDVGTKLDLARAYIEMSDPDGARSILNEVLEEGDSAEQDEARRLLKKLD